MQEKLLRIPSKINFPFPLGFRLVTLVRISLE
ncbi:MAG: hypothetical protein ACJAQT_002058 [Akkermansiaceae bacterium]